MLSSRHFLLKSFVFDCSASELALYDKFVSRQDTITSWGLSQTLDADALLAPHLAIVNGCFLDSAEVPFLLGDELLDKVLAQQVLFLSVQLELDAQLVDIDAVPDQLLYVLFKS